MGRGRGGGGGGGGGGGDTCTVPQRLVLVPLSLVHTAPPLEEPTGRRRDMLP